MHRAEAVLLSARSAYGIEAGASTSQISRLKSERNLSEWRKHGYQKWLAYRNFVDESNALSDNTEGIAETGINCDKLLLTLTAAYAECTSRSASWTVAERQLHGGRSLN